MSVQSLKKFSKPLLRSQALDTKSGSKFEREENRENDGESVIKKIRKFKRV